ncbi:hypothetical protein HDU84_000912 [Entophlyctis sp. JEL0112]|nr:hypothetical protein HDU84_000912 [Entophlyctis sp. JEL0112]
MSGSTMFVGWLYNGAAVVSQRASTGHTTPAYESGVFTAAATPADVAVPASAGCAFTIAVPASAGVVSTTGATSLIYGIGSSAPTTPASASSAFPQHTAYGAFSLDVSQLGATTTGAAGAASAVDLVLLHAALMAVAWGVFPFAAIFVARHCKDALGHWWFVTHKYLFLVGVGGAMVAGLVCVELSLDDGEARFSSSSHAVLGAVIAFALYPAQVALGFVSDRLFRADRAAVPWWDKLHWWMGRVIVIVALAEIQLGFNLYQDERGLSIGVIAGFWAWVCVAILLVFGFFGEYRMGGVVHHVATPDVAMIGETTGFVVSTHSRVANLFASSNKDLPVIYGA